MAVTKQEQTIEIMTEDSTSKIDVWIETGSRITKQELRMAFAKSGDRFYHEDIPEFEVKSGEVPEDGIPGYIQFETTGDIEGMTTETNWYLPTELSKIVAVTNRSPVTAEETPQPTQEEIEAMIPDEYL